RWNRTSLVSLKRRVHQPSLPVTQNKTSERTVSAVVRELSRGWPQRSVAVPSNKRVSQCERRIARAIGEGGRSAASQYPLINGAERKNRTFTARLSVACSAFELFLQSIGAPFGNRTRICWL